MTETRIKAFRKLWAATQKNPCRAHAKGPRKTTLDAMKSECLVQVINGGYILTSAGHAVANKLRMNGWKTMEAS